MSEPGEPSVWYEVWEKHARFLRAVQDPAASDEVRPEVVQAICDLTMHMLSQDIPKIEADMRLLAAKRITPAERERADDLFMATEMASMDHRERRLEAIRVLTAERSKERPLGDATWAELFGELTPERADRIRELYDDLPDGAREEFDRRYGRPDED